MEREITKSYYAIIPANVRYDKDLPANAKLLYGEITALCNEKGYCWATNDYFANLYGVSKTSISKWVSALVKKGYISNDLIYKEGTKQIDERYLRIVNEPIKQKLNTPIENKLKDNITLSNNTINNKNNNSATAPMYFSNENLNTLFTEFLEMRKKLKAVNSERAINMLINKLNKYDDITKIKMLENSILNSWKDVYQLKGTASTKNANTGEFDGVAEAIRNRAVAEEYDEEYLKNLNF